MQWLSAVAPLYSRMQSQEVGLLIMLLRSQIGISPHISYRVLWSFYSIVHSRSGTKGEQIRFSELSQLMVIWSQMEITANITDRDLGLLYCEIL